MSSHEEVFGQHAMFMRNTDIMRNLRNNKMEALRNRNFLVRILSYSKIDSTTL